MVEQLHDGLTGILEDLSTLGGKQGARSRLVLGLEIITDIGHGHELNAFLGADVLDQTTTASASTQNQGRILTGSGPFEH